MQLRNDAILCDITEFPDDSVVLSMGIINDDPRLVLGPG